MCQQHVGVDLEVVSIYKSQRWRGTQSGCCGQPELHFSLYIAAFLSLHSVYLVLDTPVQLLINKCVIYQS